MNTYIIVCENESNQLLLSPYIVDKCEDSKHTYLIKYDEQPSNMKTPPNAQKYLNKINDLNIEQFNWNYYVSKYSDLTKVKTKQVAWDHWLKFGAKEHRNPFDKRTIVHETDINYSWAIMTALVHAMENKSENVLIIHNQYAYQNKNQTCIDIDEIINNYQNVVKNKNICVFSYMQIPYAYLIKASLFKWLLCETSYFIYKFDEIVKMYYRTYNDQYQIFNHTNLITLLPYNQLNYLKLPVIHLNDSTLNQRIKQHKYKQFKAEYDQLVQTYKLNNTDIAQMNHILCQVPYDVIKYSFNNHVDLNFYNYLKLIMNVVNNSFQEKIVVIQPSFELSNFNTIYFDYEFYIQLYPSYKEAFRSQFEAYTHYLRQGPIEKLICNELIFELIQKKQQYIKYQMINEFDRMINYEPAPIFFNVNDMNYYNDQKPIIYVMTRTSNRETLFKECCRSLMEQKFVNIRHIVGYDTETTKQYVSNYPHIYQKIDLTSYKFKIHPNQYIDVMYEQLLLLEPGWVMILDDDDKFMTDYALYHLEKHFNDPKNLIIWMLYRPDKFIYPKNKNIPIVGEIGSCCYIYHTSMIKNNLWQGNAIGDFSFFKYIFDQTTSRIYVDYPLTGINYVGRISGWSAM